MNLKFSENIGFESDGKILEIGVNSGDPENHNVFMAIFEEDDTYGGEGYELEGKQRIKAVLYEIAKAGGLVDEDGELVITKPSERVIPEDGLYTHKHWAGGTSYVIVKDGRLFVPQVDVNGKVYENGSVLEMTEEYLESDNDLVPVKLGA